MTPCRVRSLLVVLVALGCSGGSGAPKHPTLVPSSPRLPALQPIDPNAHGAPYLTTLANQIQPRWAQFLEDCRMRLPGDHPLNIASLTTDVELVIERSGKLTARVMQPSGNSDFDDAALEVLREAAPAAPPPELESDDGLVHVHWVFARDRRQAGPATASVIVVELPLIATVKRMLDAGNIARAAKRLAAAPASDAERQPATELVMIAALREGLESSDGYTREAALEAVRGVRLAVLAPDVQRLITSAGQIEQRVQAIAASAALGDMSALPLLVDELAQSFEDRPEIALAKVSALAVLGRPEEAARAIKDALAHPEHKRGLATAIAALAIVPDDKLASQLAKWFGRGDAEIRQSVCLALPQAAPQQALALVMRGLRDPDANVRATCATSAVRPLVTGTKAVRAWNRELADRLVALTRDRDESVRVHAVAALGSVDPSLRPRDVFRDRAARVRAAAVIGASDADLRALAADNDADVRAAAIATLADRASDIATTAAADKASQVRRAAVAGVTDDTLLEKLANDADPEVATAALVRYGARRGRAAITTELLARLVTATPKSLERVRIARSWLLAR
jgi:TonB family protein